MLSGPWHQALGHCLGRTDSCWGVGNGGFSLSGIHTLYLFPSTVLQSKLGVCWPPSTVSFVFPVYFSLFRACHVKFLFSDSYLFLRLSCLFSVCVCVSDFTVLSRDLKPRPHCCTECCSIQSILILNLPRLQIAPKSALHFFGSPVIHSPTFT